MVDEIRKIAERLAAHDETDVTWLAERDRQRGGNQLCVAPIQVWGQLRHKLLADKTVVFTSATLKLGGDFTSVATSIGLKPTERVDHSIDDPADASAPAAVDVDAEAGEPDADAPRSTPSTLVLPWRGIDVGSPFDYGAQAILYVARTLPPPGRDGLGTRPDRRDRRAARGGRTAARSGCSRRGAQPRRRPRRCARRCRTCRSSARATASCRTCRPSSSPTRRSACSARCRCGRASTCPGETCQLVIIDRIPFPRPDDPLMSARSRAAERAGGNGFMAVSATHAALLLAQGAGRLIRTKHDRGVVAILDPRIATARYGTFLRASLPPMWPHRTTARSRRSALRRLSAARQPPTRARQRDRLLRPCASR